jgi:predicted PurR-regulated permease PerM
MDLSQRFNSIGAAVVSLVFIATVYVTKDFFSTILLSIVLTYLLKPVYDRIQRLIKQRQISSFLSILIVFLILTSVILLAADALSTEITSLQGSGDLANLQFSNLSETMNIFVEGFLPEPISQYLREMGDTPAAIASRLLPAVEAETSAFAANLPIYIAQLIVVVFFTYYILIDGRMIVDKAVELLPRKEVSQHFLGELNSIYNTLFSVYFTTSMLSGVLAAIGFFFLGIPYFLLWGVVIAIFTLIPLLGPPAVFVPMSIYYLLSHEYLKSVIILVFGTVFLMIIPENVIRPHLAMRSAQIHPIITVLAYTAPVFVVGVMGVVIGPALYGFLLAAYRTALHFREAEGS